VADTVIKTLKKHMKDHQRDFDKSSREHKRRLDEMSSQLEKLSKILPKGKKAKRKPT
jgi:ribosomal protein S15P/S13E